MNSKKYKKNESFGIQRTTLPVLAVAITFGSFSVYKALGGGSTKAAGTFQVPSSGIRLPARSV